MKEIIILFILAISYVSADSSDDLEPLAYIEPQEWAVNPLLYSARSGEDWDLAHNVMVRFEDKSFSTVFVSYLEASGFDAFALNISSPLSQAPAVQTSLSSGISAFPLIYTCEQWRYREIVSVLIGPTQDLHSYPIPTSAPTTFVLPTGYSILQVRESSNNVREVFSENPAVGATFYLPPGLTMNCFASLGSTGTAPSSCFENVISFPPAGQSAIAGTYYIAYWQKNGNQFIDLVYALFSGIPKFNKSCSEIERFRSASGSTNYRKHIHAPGCVDW